MISKKSLPNKLGNQYITSQGLVITAYNTGKLVVQGKTVFPTPEEFQSLQDLLGPQTANLIRALTDRFKKERIADLPNAEQAYKLIRLLAVRLTPEQLAKLAVAEQIRRSKNPKEKNGKNLEDYRLRGFWNPSRKKEAPREDPPWKP